VTILELLAKVAQTSLKKKGGKRAGAGSTAEGKDGADGW
jgi:hypothetical protein